MKYREKILQKQILTYLINRIILHVADNYLAKLEKDKKNPHKLIQDYFDKSVYLTVKIVKIKKLNSKLKLMDENNVDEFVELINQDKEYLDLFKQLNFGYRLIVDEKLQQEVINEMYNNFKKNYKSVEKINKKNSIKSLLNKFSKMLFSDKSSYLTV